MHKSLNSFFNYSLVIEIFSLFLLLNSCASSTGVRNTSIKTSDTDISKISNRPDINNKRAVLFQASILGFNSIILNYIDNGGDINIQDNYGYTPLMYAAFNSRTNTVRLLISHGAVYDPKFKTYDNQTYLSAFSQCGLSDLVKDILDKGADVNGTPDNGWNALLCASALNHPETAKLLIASGAKYDKDYRTGNNVDYLLAFSECGLTNQISELIAQGADVNATDINGWTPLLGACYTGHLDTIKILIKAGANINAKNINGWTGLLEAAVHKYINIVRYLIENGCTYSKDYKTGEGVTYLLAFSECGITDEVKKLLDEGADVNVKDNHNWTPLIGACFYNNYDVLNILINYGADVNAVNDDGWTGLMDAAAHNYNYIVTLLLNKGAKYDKDFKSLSGMTYLMAFSACGLSDKVKELISDGADVNVKDKYGYTALYYANLKNQAAIVDILRQNGAY
jgi:ankyrin repeat protein